MLSKYLPLRILFIILDNYRALKDNGGVRRKYELYSRQRHFPEEVAVAA